MAAISRLAQLAVQLAAQLAFSRYRCTAWTSQHLNCYFFTFCRSFWLSVWTISTKIPTYCTFKLSVDPLVCVKSGAI